jgi:alkylation response protein AidB-like acyl-CoA dehydrogenase
MELEFTPEQEDLRRSVRTVLERECPISLVRRVVEKGTPADELWATLVALGWPALGIPEEHGGLGLGFVELAVVLEELGRAVAPVPYLATVTQFAPVVREAGDPTQQARFLGAVASGGITGAVATGVRAHLQEGHWVLDGTARYVLDGSTADEIAVVATVEAGDGTGLFVVPREAVTVTPVRVVDATRPVAHLTFANLPVAPDRVLGEPGALARASERAREEATVAVALEALGTCQAIFDIALAYAKVREQFGVPIGSFQAIKHKFADMLVALEKARATAYFAACTIAEDDPRRTLAASMAKAAIGDCQRLIAQEGIQILGGIGYTWEHDMHLYVKRAKTAEALFGTAREHRARVAALIGLG